MDLRTALALGLELGSVSPYYALQDLKKALKRQVKSGTPFAVHLSEYPPTPADLPEELLSVAYVEEEPLTSEAVNELTMHKASGSGAVALRRKRTSDALVPTSTPAPASSSQNAGLGIETLVQNTLMGLIQQGFSNFQAHQQGGGALNNLQVFKNPKAADAAKRETTEVPAIEAPKEEKKTTPVEPTKASILPTQEEVSDVDPKVVQAALDQRKDAGYTKPKAKAKGKAKAQAAAAKPKAKPKAKAKAVAKTKAKASAPVKSTHDPKDPGIGGGTVWWGGGKIQCNHPEHYRLFIRSSDRCDRKIRRGSGAWERCLEAIKNGP